MSRTENSVKNYFSNLFTTIISNLLNVISRTVFIYILGADYLGVNGLFSNLLAMLSLAELGIGSAINFSLYKPVAEQNEKKIICLMSFYKKCYRIIAIIVFCIGMVMMLFLDYLVKDPGNIQHIRLIFLIYVINTSYSYLLTYKNTLLNACQKDYLLLKSNLFFSILNILAQMIVLVITRNYICYLISNMLVLFLQRLYVNSLINRTFPIVLSKIDEKIDKKELFTIKKNVKAMIWHKLGDYCINGTDNIIISMFLSIKIVGYYSNYLMIINMVMAYVNMIFNNMTASMGNLISIEKEEKRYLVFKKINFIGVWLYGFISVCLFILLNPFLKLWIGKQYVLSFPIVAVIVLNNYMMGMRIPPFIVKSAAGLYAEDQFVPIVQSAVNLIVSIILAQKIGLIGVFIGTLVSGLLPCFYRPYLIYKKVFRRNSIGYYINYLRDIFNVIVVIIIIEVIDFFMSGVPEIVRFIINMGLCVIITNFIFLILYHKQPEFRELLNIGENLCKKIKQKKQVL